MRRSGASAGIVNPSPLPPSGHASSKRANSGCSSAAAGVALRVADEHGRLVRLAQQLDDPRGLGGTLVDTIVLQVRVREPHAGPVDAHDGLQQPALLTALRARQQGVARRDDREPREDCRAVLATRLAGVVRLEVEVRAVDDVHVEQPPEPPRLVDELGTHVEVAVDLLQADHVGPGRLELGGDALDVEAPVDAGGVVDVVGGDGELGALGRRRGRGQRDGGHHRREQRAFDQVQASDAMWRLPQPLRRPGYGVAARRG